MNAGKWVVLVLSRIRQRQLTSTNATNDIYAHTTNYKPMPECLAFFRLHSSRSDSS